MNRTEDFPKLWIGSFIKTCLVNFLIFVNFHALLPTFPFFISSLGYFISAGIATVDTPLKLGELFEPMSVPAAVTQLFFMMAYGVVEVYVAIYAVLHCLPSEGIYFIGIAVAGTCGGKSGEARLVYTGNAAIITGILLLVFAHNIPCYLLLWQHCWDTVSELCSLPCRPWPCLSKDEVPQALRFSWLSISGLHWEDFSRITREIPGI